MPKPIYLPLATVIEKGRKAYLAGELSAQGPTPACLYRDRSGRPCIIGAALTVQQAHLLDAQAVPGIWFCTEDPNLVTTDDREALKALQLAHDDWARGHATEKNLRRLLGLDPA